MRQSDVFEVFQVGKKLGFVCFYPEHIDPINTILYFRAYIAWENFFRDLSKSFFLDDRSFPA